MRKAICTSTIFAAMVGCLAAGFVIQVPAVWWWSDWSGVGFPQQMQFGIVWLFMSTLFPLSGFVIAITIPGVVIYGLWNLADIVCRKLRNEGGTNAD